MCFLACDEMKSFQAMLYFASWCVVSCLVRQGASSPASSLSPNLPPSPSQPALASAPKERSTRSPPSLSLRPSDLSKPPPPPRPAAPPGRPPAPESPRSASAKKIVAISSIKDDKRKRPFPPASDTAGHRLVNVSNKAQRRNASDSKKVSEPASSAEIFGAVNSTGVTLWLDDQLIYASSENMFKGNKTKYHAGIHVVVLHQHHFTVLQKEQFFTWQPAAHRMLTKMLKHTQFGRILILVGVPDFTPWFRADATKAVVSLGALFGSLATRGETWVMVTLKGQPPIMETLVTCKNASLSHTSPVTFSATVPRSPERVCPWHSEPDMAMRAEFCEQYEGYADFCRCEDPLRLDPKMAMGFKPPLKMREVIPVALVTAKRLPMVLRQVFKIRQNPGGADTPLVIFVDGHNPEAEKLGKILNITVVFHDNPAPIGSIHRVNQHIKFSLDKVFKMYPESDKAIILEDDLNIAPDFISYFHQTALLMKFDKTVSIVNAYNYNAYPHTASDPARIYRVQSYPYYGWMTRRGVAETMVKNWAPMDLAADWDLYIRKYHVNMCHQVIIPEIPRTKHEGGGGVHVSGNEQETSFQQRPLNTQRDVQLNLIRLWEIAYGIDMRTKIDQARVVNITEHPCDKKPIPKYKNETYVIYVNLTGEDDYERSYHVLGKCMGFYYPYLYENYHGTFSLKFFKTPFIIVSCPASAYCWNVDPSVIYYPTTEDLDYATKHAWRHSHAKGEYAVRVPAFTPEEEFNLDNVLFTYFTIQQ
ncbi:protein O-linked-mannose beta-1,2-N-acetylglucosaminyltransferase 1-like [Penaeus chinensis]|uniref:protein O-linked-mannose beta-1,2-N-acetylglucosaminyltransferase 1-like n=1 Tax=Penaeus chinensis TaxID=139456 RepID=UPI001FB5B735|nr:protein O-linked-mannose beta-1,2-N-acetylglucosaminyltransferase 1-like [Penaeus chinensis]